MVLGSSRLADSDRGHPSRSFSMPSTAHAAAGAAAIVIAYIVLKLGWPERSVVKAVDTFIFPALGLVYVPLCALVAIRARGRLQVAWWAMTIGLASWALGEFVYAYYELRAGQPPFPSWADAAYLLYVPCVVLALVLLPSARTWRDQGRMILDGVIVAGSFFLISWLVVMRAVWQSEHPGGVSFAMSMAYPVGDVLLVTLGFLVLLRAPSGLRPTFTLLVAGLACGALADSTWVYLQNSTDRPASMLPDILYVANAVLIIVALVAAYHAGSGSAAFTDPTSRLSLWLPVVPLLGAAVLVAASPRDAATGAPVVVAGAVLIGATLLRQGVESSELVRREHEIRHLADRLTEELDSAAQYVASILPGALDGPVHVSSRYVPARAVGGDSFGYRWIDDDHLTVYLVDVSGHGVKPALLSVSVHNHLRAGGLATEVLLAPDRVLTELNARFGMDNHDGHYFTMWYGVYERSSGVLRYANAGHPPPLVLTADGATIESFPLTGASMPAGMFPDIEFSTDSFAVPAGSRILLYSDGVLGDPPHMAEFVALCKELAAGSSFWLDDLIDQAPASEDDCSVVLLAFPDSTGLAGAAAGAALAASAERRR